MNDTELDVEFLGLYIFSCILALFCPIFAAFSIVVSSPVLEVVGWVIVWWLLVFAVAEYVMILSGLIDLDKKCPLI